jgi:hypothetical protein
VSDLLDTVVPPPQAADVAPAPESAGDLRLAQFKEQLDAYQRAPILERSADPLKWWQENGSRYPDLREFARERLAVQATSTASERLFSNAGVIVSSLRWKLTPKHASMFIYIHGNRRFIPGFTEMKAKIKKEKEKAQQPPAPAEEKKEKGSGEKYGGEEYSDEEVMILSALANSK